MRNDVNTLKRRVIAANKKFLDSCVTIDKTTATTRWWFKELGFEVNETELVGDSVFIYDPNQLEKSFNDCLQA